MVDRQIIYPRGRVGPTEWIMERRVLIACGLGILCFVVGFMAAGPRLNAGDRIVHSAPPEIVVQPNRAAAPAPTARSPLAPEIEVFPVADATPEVKESEITARVSESPDREVERPRRKKRI